LLVKARELSDKYNALLAIHAEEGLVDVYHNIEHYGMRPIERLFKLGFLGPRTHLVHLVQATDDELLLVKKSGSHVAHNPMSNMLNAVGVAKIPEMTKMGINVGLGNDGYIFDQYENMRAAYLLHKVSRRDPRVMTPIEVFEMTTVNVARMFHQEKQLGSIEPGKKADLTILKPKTPNTPVNSKTIYGHLVNTFSSRDVDTVIVDGKYVLKEGRLVNIDEEEAIEYIHKVVEKLWDKLMSEGVPQIDFIK